MADQSGGPTQPSDAIPETPDRLEWTTEDSRQAQKGADWYWAVILIAVSLGVAAILFNNHLFAVLIVIGAGALIIHSIKAPEEMPVRIDERGITVAQEHYSYRDLESFWVEVEAGEPTLLLKSQKLLMPLISIPINPNEVDLDDVADYLIEFLHEEELMEPFSQKVMEWFGF